jgi:hypothetical protein
MKAPCEFLLPGKQPVYGFGVSCMLHPVLKMGMLLLMMMVLSDSHQQAIKPFAIKLFSGQAAFSLLLFVDMY